MIVIISLRTPIINLPASSLLCQAQTNRSHDNGVQLRYMDQLSHRIISCQAVSVT